MAISYNGLWKLLIDNGIHKGELCKRTVHSSRTMAKMTNGESVKLKKKLIFDPKSRVVEEATPETYVEDTYVTKV